MGQRLPPREAELYRRCNEVLQYIWDPMGVAGVPEARDEYDAYVPQVFQLVLKEADEAAVRDHLLRIEVDRMGLAANAAQAQEVARILRNWRDVIWERAAKLS